MLLWLVCLQFFVTLLVLVGPRPALPFVDVDDAENAFRWNDLLDGVVLPMVASLLYRALFQSTSSKPEEAGFSVVPLLLLVIRTAGAGAHSVANSSDILHGHDLRDGLGRHLFRCHEYYAHSLFYGGEFGLLALYLWRVLSRKMPQKQQQVLVLSNAASIFSILLAAFHGLISALLTIGTRTSPALIPVHLVVGACRKSCARSDVGRYAVAWSAASILVVMYWTVKHRFPPPTFGDLQGEYST